MSEPRFLASPAVLNVVAMRDFDALTAELQAADYSTLVLDGSGIASEEALFAAASDQLFGGLPTANWDSFVDRLRNLVDDEDGGDAALVWTSAEQMLRGDLAGLLVAADVVADTARGLTDPDATFLAYFVGASGEFHSVD